MPSYPKVLHHDDELFIGAWCDVTLIIWKRDTTVEGAEACARAVHATAAQNGGHSALLTLVPSKIPMPPREARQALGKALQSVGGELTASAVVHQGDGFRSAAVRLMVRGLGLLVETEYPHRIFSTVEQGAQWLVGQHGACDAASGRSLARIVHGLEVDVLGRSRGGR